MTQDPARAGPGGRDGEVTQGIRLDEAGAGDGWWGAYGAGGDWRGAAGAGDGWWGAAGAGGRPRVIGLLSREESDVVKSCPDFCKNMYFAHLFHDFRDKMLVNAGLLEPRV